MSADRQVPNPVALELLAPARNADVARAAIDHGADAVYIGADAYGARVRASNSIDEIAEVVRYAHPYGVRVYVTLNTILYDNELTEAYEMVRRLYRTGVDALIVQDMALLDSSLPPIDLHASTQCDIRTVRRARWLRDQGFSQLVLPREFSPAEVAQVVSQVGDVRYEVFVHGALCVSYSGDCRASYMCGGRSANRGDCAQVCRLPFVLRDGQGRELSGPRYWLSLKDMNRMSSLEDYIRAGATSFKIEGRLKEAAYVKNAVAAYSRALDSIVAASDGRYVRQSKGRCLIDFEPDTSREFNRGFTPYILDHRRVGAVGIMSDSPKWEGCEVGNILSAKGKILKVKTTSELHNGDGITYRDRQEQLQGARINRVEGDTIYLSNRADAAPGTVLRRNYDIQRTRQLERETGKRFIDIDMTLRHAGELIVLDVAMQGRIVVTATCEFAERDAPHSDPCPRREAELKSTGGTPYRVSSVEDLCADIFIPISVVASLKRRALELLATRQRVTYPFMYRKRRRHSEVVPKPEDGRMNVANKVAENVYCAAGCTSPEPAVEVKGSNCEPVRVMTTRHCIRRESGRCLRTPQGELWRGPLTLESDGKRFELRFDCDKCEMNLYKI